MPPGLSVPPLPGGPHVCVSSAKCLHGGARGLSSLHPDMLKTRPQHHPTPMPKVGQLLFVTEGPHPPELPGVWGGGAGKSFDHQGGPQSIPRANTLELKPFIHSFIHLHPFILASQPCSFLNDPCDYIKPTQIIPLF